MWITDLTDWKSPNQFVFASIAMIVTGLFAFTFNVPAENNKSNIDK
jgi:NHS family xanthosine MFS transporter